MGSCKRYERPFGVDGGTCYVYTIGDNLWRMDACAILGPDVALHLWSPTYLPTNLQTYTHSLEQ